MFCQYFIVILKHNLDLSIIKFIIITMNALYIPLSIQ